MKENQKSQQSCKKCFFWKQDKIEHSGEEIGSCTNSNFNAHVKIMNTGQLIKYVKEPRLAVVIANSMKVNANFLCQNFKSKDDVQDKDPE